MQKFAIDTSVWIESIAENSEYFEIASRFIDGIDKGKITAIVTPITATETYYISYRLYKKVGLDENEAIFRAELLFNTLFSHRNIRVIAINKDLSLLAGEIKREYHISLSDSFLLAAARHENAVAVFRKIEKEMEPYIADLRENFEIVFLSEIRIK